MAALTITQLTKTFHRGKHTTHALADVSFTVEEGEIFGLLGPNGAGKSTLIGVLSGIVIPDTGRITVLGHDVVTKPRLAKTAVGIVPQEITFDPFLRYAKFCVSKAGITACGITTRGLTNSWRNWVLQTKRTKWSLAFRAA